MDISGMQKIQVTRELMESVGALMGSKLWPGYDKYKIAPQCAYCSGTSVHIYNNIAMHVVFGTCEKDACPDAPHIKKLL